MSSPSVSTPQYAPAGFDNPAEGDGFGDPSRAYCGPLNARWVVVLIVLPLLALYGFVALVTTAEESVVAHEALIERKVYAYRTWQSVGVEVRQGDTVHIQAEGRWLYSPFVGYHGPEGYRHYRAPDFYPLPGTPSGALIGRIGEEQELSRIFGGNTRAGEPFYVGRRLILTAPASGRLYLRINDDIVSDNDGYVVVHIQVEAEE